MQLQLLAVNALTTIGSEDNCFQDGADFAKDLFDHDGFVPTLDEDGIRVMPKNR